MSTFTNNFKWKGSTCLVAVACSWGYSWRSTTCCPPIASPRPLLSGWLDTCHAVRKFNGIRIIGLCILNDILWTCSSWYFIISLTLINRSAQLVLAAFGTLHQVSLCFLSTTSCWNWDLKRDRSKCKQFFYAHNGNSSKNGERIVATFTISRSSHSLSTLHLHENEIIDI